MAENVDAALASPAGAAVVESAAPAADVPVQPGPKDPYGWDDPSQSAASAPAEGDGDENIASAESASGEPPKEPGDAVAADAAVAAEAAAEELRVRAELVGFSKEEVAELGDKLGVFVNVAERRVFELGQAALASPAPPAGGGAVLPPPAAKPEVSSAAKLPEKFAVSLDPEVYDEGLRKELARIVEYFEGRMGAVNGEQLSAQVTEALGYINRQKVEEEDRQFENLLDGLGAAYVGLVGKGSFNDLLKKHGSWAKVAAAPEYVERAAIKRTMDALAAGYAKVSRQVPPFPELFKSAVRLHFADRQQELTRKEISASLVKRRGQAISRPSQRKPDGTVSPEAAAVATVRAHLDAMRARGEFG